MIDAGEAQGPLGAEPRLGGRDGGRDVAGSTAGWRLQAQVASGGSWNSRRPGFALRAPWGSGGTGGRQKHPAFRRSSPTSTALTGSGVALPVERTIVRTPAGPRPGLGCASTGLSRASKTRGL